MHSDPIADLLTRIRNAGHARKKKVVLPYSKIKFQIAQLLYSNGYLKNVKEEIIEGKKQLVVFVKYHENRSVISELVRISKPGLRKYVAGSELPKVRSGFGLSILTTSKGLMTGADAKKHGVGGEIICTVF